MKKQDYIDVISSLVDDADGNSVSLRNYVYFYTEDTDREIGDAMCVDEVYKGQAGDDERIYVRFSGDFQDKPLEDCNKYELKLIYDDVAEGEDEPLGVYELADHLGIDEGMSCDKIFNTVFDYYRNIHDGQVSDLIVAETAEGATEEVCDYVGVEYHRQDWT